MLLSIIQSVYATGQSIYATITARTAAASMLPSETTFVNPALLPEPDAAVTVAPGGLKAETLVAKPVPVKACEQMMPLRTNSHTACSSVGRCACCHICERGETDTSIRIVVDAVYVLEESISDNGDVVSVRVLSVLCNNAKDALFA